MGDPQQSAREDQGGPVFNGKQTAESEMKRAAKKSTDDRQIHSFAENLPHSLADTATL